MRRIKVPPLPSIIAAVVFAVTMIFLKWGTAVSFDMMFLAVGVLIGLILLDVVDSLFPTSTSLLHSVVGVVIVAIAVFFVVTSSGSIVGSGLVLSLFLRMITEQVQEYIGTGQIASWFAGNQSIWLQRGVLVVSVLIFLLYSYVFTTLP